MEIIKWDIYEITNASTPITGIMLRGRIRKFCLENEQNVLVENANDVKEVVRFAIPAEEDASEIIHYLHKILPEMKTDKVMKSVPNPVLSKLKVNIDNRYTL